MVPLTLEVIADLLVIIKVMYRQVYSTTTDLSFIKKKLLNSRFTVRNIIPVSHKLTKTPLPIFFIDLKPGPTNTDIFKITSLCYTIVKIDPAHPKRDIP